MQKQLLTTAILFLLVYCIKSDALWFMRNLTCLQIYEPVFGSPFCKTWNQTTKMYFYLDYFHLCFPQGTQVMSEQGPKRIEELEIGDKILALNQESGEEQFSPVIAWISRDSEALSIFTLIQTQNQQQYFLSPLHNIAIRSQNNDVSHQFVFANSLQDGDTLVYAYNKAASPIIAVKSSSQMQGLYAPLTRNSNFFILPYNSSQNINQSMILVHSYTQIKNPTTYEQYLTPLLYISHLLFQHEDNYLNPLYTKLRYLLGDDWQDQNNTIRYDLHQMMAYHQPQNLRQQKQISKGGGGGGKGGGGKGGGRSSSRSSSHSSTHSSFSNRRRARKKSAVKLFSLLSIMKNTIFNV